MPAASEFTTRPELAGTFGMVASTHWLASAAGLSVLEKGGNAFDAAVAAGLVLQIVEPHLSGPGGEVPIIGFDARRGETFVIDGQGPAPRAATPGAYAALDVDLIPGNGLLAACVPGAFGAWMLLLRDHGVARLRDVLSYAIDYAGGGYPVVPALSGAIGSVAELFRDHWPSSAEVYLPGGQVPAPGSRFSHPQLAATYQRILDEAESAARGRDEQIDAARHVFYEGFVAEALADYLDFAEVMDATGRPNRGLLAYDDLAAWRPGVETPLTLDYAGLTVCKTQPWGQGPVFLQQLALLAGFDLAAMGPGSADFIHTVVECAKLAFADREAWYGDPEFTDVPIPGLLSPGYAGERRRLVGPAASADLVPGAPGGRQPRLPGFASGPFGHTNGTSYGRSRNYGAGGDPGLDLSLAPRLDPGTGEPTVPASSGRRGDTCHVDVADRSGNIVSATPSGAWLQSSPVIPALGFCLGTRAQMFTLEPGLPATLAPGKRPRTTLSPGLALRDGEPYLAFGTPGGDQQDQWTLAFFLNHVHFGMNLQQAIDAAEFHTRHFPSSFYPRESAPRTIDVEERVGEQVIAELRRRGHEVAVYPPWSLGRVSAVARRDGMLYAAANPRGMQGYAVGR
jgi:gamma-glutamyltranspeptidase / glutathione hydrolase